ncbi:MAG: hypothetical protein H7276_09980 [Caulobacter sp.]|nr:hypothetical protein [Vitreoscilla sp.]
MSLRSLIVRRCLQSCVEATGLRAVNLPHVVDARQHVDPPVRVDAGYLVVDRRAFARITFSRTADGDASTTHTTGYATLSGALRAICAERIGVAGRAAIPGPKRAVELRREGRWQEVLDASERVEAPMRARLEAWLRGGRFRAWRTALGLFKRL